MMVNTVFFNNNKCQPQTLVPLCRGCHNNFFFIILYTDACRHNGKTRETKRGAEKRMKVRQMRENTRWLQGPLHTADNLESLSRKVFVLRDPNYIAASRHTPQSRGTFPADKSRTNSFPSARTPP